MNSHTTFNLTRKAIFAGIIAAAFPIISSGAAGKVEFAVGNVNALSADGRSRALTKGNEINAGDTIQTTDGRVQARFSDGGYISLQPNTQFKVEEYNFNGKADGSEKGFFNLVKGGLRAITGSIGHTNRKAYQINTPVATIGIRGTELVGQIIDAPTGPKLLVKVGDGAVYLSNPAGDLIIYKGQSGEVGGSSEKPKQSTETPSLAAAGPTGGKPGETQNEQQQQQQVNQIFIAGDLKDESGKPCTGFSTSGGCGFLSDSDVTSQILAANASGATGFWSGSSSFSAGSLGSGTAFGTLAVDFSNYSISQATVDATFTSGSYSGSTLFGSAFNGAAGSLNMNGTFGNPGFSSVSASDNTGSNFICSGCTFTIHGGSISGANLNTANMTYSFTGSGGDAISTHPISNNVIQMTGGLSSGGTSGL